ncbi:hypothetical protein LOK46_29600 [Methylobacterium sp. NMS14P]|uniref:hypothetical protein n=1 Tax=Methylobacterium sp. NMS14P TaxID=2894310 RepID=UPI002359CB7C|nr:hypothetical protein [Methylobacterium sp. NMS14P]WCS25222.1 hypothetical protein LOK46_29600 [Methylobacterium sp. NMS14P]
MADSTATPQYPRDMSARAARDYAWSAAQEHRGTVRRLLEAGTRGNAAVAIELNRLAAPSPSGRRWDARSAGRLLKRLGVRWEEQAQLDAEALREPMEELWEAGVRVRAQVAIALTRMAVPTRDGRPWTADRAGTLIRRLGLDWSDSAPRLRRGNSVPEVIEFPGVAELVAAIEPEATPVIEATGPIQVLKPQEAAPRRRAIRV